MQIQVLGSGCMTCKKLFEFTKKAAAELNLNTEVDYVTDVQKIVAMGLLSSPVLTVNGKPILVGHVPDAEKIKELLAEAVK